MTPIQSMLLAVMWLFIAALPYDAFAAIVHDAFVIYGNDDREEVYSLKNAALEQIARSTAAITETRHLQRLTELTWKISGPKAAFRYNLCPQERFAQQRSAAFCSAALIGDDLILTAGHCVPDKVACATAAFVFDYRLRDANDSADSAKTEEVYTCSEVLYSKVDDQSDISIVRLDRKVQERTPLTIGEPGALLPGDGVFVLGHPLGVPMKFSDSAIVRTVGAGYFDTDLDVFVGNSGAPVFGLESFAIEGVLVSGEEDFDRLGNCNIAKRCNSTSCKGERAVSIDSIRDVIEKLCQNDSARIPFPRP